jgi:hypothetical protein
LDFALALLAITDKNLKSIMQKTQTKQAVVVKAFI